MREFFRMACTSLGAAVLFFVVVLVVRFYLGDRASDMACGAILGGAVVAAWCSLRTDARKSGAP